MTMNQVYKSLMELFALAGLSEGELLIFLGLMAGSFALLIFLIIASFFSSSAKSDYPIDPQVFPTGPTRLGRRSPPVRFPLSSH